MSWASAWVSMMQGHKVRRSCWHKGSYWKIAGSKVMLYTESGLGINIREVDNMAKFPGVLCCDDWEVVREEVPEEVPEDVSE